MKRFVALLTLIGLMSCQQIAPPPPAPPPPPPPVPAPEPTAAPATPSPAAPKPFAGEANTAISVREFLAPPQTLASTVATARPRAYIILDPARANKGRKVCAQYTLMAVGSNMSALPGEVFVTTYWPLRAQPAADAKCDSLVQNYDYTASAQLRARAHLPVSKGTYLLAIDQNNRSFYIDLTDASDGQISAAMAAWFVTAQSAAGAPGVAITSDNFFHRLASSACAAVSNVDVSIASTVPALLATPTVTIGYIAFKVGGTVICQRYVQS